MIGAGPGLSVTSSPGWNQDSMVKDWSAGGFSFSDQGTSVCTPPPETRER